VPPNQKIRHSRIERPAPPSETLEDNSLLWAVSYADFLMVLLSFFIIFFSYEPTKKNELMQRIIGASKTAPDARAPNAVGGGKAGTLDAKQSENLVRHMGSLFKDFKIDTKAEPAQLVIYLPDDSFAKGHTDLSHAYDKNFEDVVTALKPFEKDVVITFVGHSDQTPVRLLENRSFTDNFDLSSLRATWALRKAAKLGLDVQNLQAKGVAEYNRGSRTISILIEAKR
jgi:chemotaxis protein MotB